ncbi:hypothetical protein BDW62DRAFT_51810 [Aspergillus aurantiobrunneus]
MLRKLHDNDRYELHLGVCHYFCLSARSVSIYVQELWSPYDPTGVLASGLFMCLVLYGVPHLRCRFIPFLYPSVFGISHVHIASKLSG